jgi:uncharacterized membrane protein
VARPRGAFGDDAFGRGAERAARFFGTPKYIIGQTLVVIAWIILNAVALIGHWDPYPFILLNLAFSTQAAYAAPLILLAQTRQADRDKLHGESVEKVHEHQLATATRHEREIRKAVVELRELLESNTALTQQDKDLTEQVAGLAREIHACVVTP